MRSEGLAERVGDVVFNCSGGQPGAAITGNLSIFLNVSITNRVSGSTVTDVVFTIDNGSGPRPVTVPGTIPGPSSLVYNGVSFTLSPTGTATLRVANIRASANQLAPMANNTVLAFLGFNTSSLVSLTNTQITVAKPHTGLYGGSSSKIICSPYGSPLPDNTASFASFLASDAVFSSIRFTEGFADAFTPRSAWQSLNADTGARIMVRYSGFPPGARLFVPNVIAGSDALQPTAGGDFGVPASGGRYAPTANGSLLLSLVNFTAANGSGGTVVYTPGPPGSGAASFDAMSEVALANGSGFVVYEVVDANPSIQENAQFPSFLGLAPYAGGAIATAEDFSLAPVSTVAVATARDPIPRFVAPPVPPDCSIVGDCGAKYLPSLFVVESSLEYTASAGSNYQVGYIQVQNTSGGVMRWTTVLAYQDGSGWLRLSPTEGVNNATIRVDALPDHLAPGIYKATLTIYAGPLAGSRDVPITLLITPAPPPPVPPPAINAVIHAATFAPGPLAPGSIATLTGTHFSGTSLMVLFDGVPGQILFSTDTQINVVIPPALEAKVSAQLLVQVNGLASASQTVTLVAFAPGIFPKGILNQDGSVNSPDNPAQPGSVIQIFATGLSGAGVITARIGDQVIPQPYYRGPAPGLPGVQQVDLVLADDLTGGAVPVVVCGGPAVEQVACSPPVPINVGHGS